MRLSGLIVLETPGNGRVRRNAGVGRGLVSSRSASHSSPRKHRRRRYHLLSVVLQLLSTTSNERTSVRGPPSRTEQPQKKLSPTAPEFADAATKQRCSPSSREQQDSPSRSRRARPSPATPGTSSPSGSRSAHRRRRTAACSARCGAATRWKWTRPRRCRTSRSGTTRRQEQD